MIEQNVLFEDDVKSCGAHFSDCGKYRYALWRIWNHNERFIMFIGLNPSTANKTDDDATIESVTRIAKYNGYGGFYMMNCFPYVSTNPDDLIAHNDSPEQHLNNTWLMEIKLKCSDVVFAWGNFKIIQLMERDKELFKMFPQAKCLSKNKNGSPGHPLYKPENSKLYNWYE